MNYLVGAIFDRSQTDYMKLYDSSRRSFRTNLQGQWEELLVTADYPRPMMNAGWAAMHQDVLSRIHDLVKNGHNALYAELDTICAKPTEIFCQSQQMRLFNETCANHADFKPYLNSGVIYFPATMGEGPWEVCAKYCNPYHDGTWDYFQVVVNAMFYSQDPRPPLEPALNWSPHVPSSVDRNAAKILHFHSSRSLGETMREMGA